MSSKRGRFENKSPTATSPDITYTDPVNCQWDTCIEQFSCITDLLQHIEETHLLKGINVCFWRNCQRNKKPFKFRCRLVTHIQIHPGEKHHRCPVSPLPVLLVLIRAAPIFLVIVTCFFHLTVSRLY